MEVENTLPKIRVAIRKRPLSKKEVAAGERDVVEAVGESIVVREQRQKLDLTKYTEEHTFKFDEVFGEEATNAEVYARTLRPLMTAALNGAKVSCFAYGQTGSGKTFTMIGSDKNPGLYLLAANDLFGALATPAFAGLTALTSYFEIYCGKIFDLLNGRKLLSAREDAKQNIHIVNLRRVPVAGVNQLFELINCGNGVRVTSTTGKNTDSSRSHAVLQIRLFREKKQAGLFSFIDLAGNERGNDTVDHDEKTRLDGAEISKSLLALKECIRDLDQNSKHIRFRGSKLTMVLRDSFMGDSKTIMIGNISPGAGNTEYTLNTLRYADRVKELRKDPKDRSRDELMLPRRAENRVSRPVEEQKLISNEIEGFVEEEIMLEEPADQLIEAHQKLIN